MSYSPTEQAAIDRLKTKYNSNAYNPATNPGGFANDGHQVNFPAALADTGNAAAAVGVKADEVGANKVATDTARAAAEQAATNAATHSSNAGAAKTASEAARDTATTRKNEAEAARDIANTRKTEAEAARDAAQLSETNAAAHEASSFSAKAASEAARDVATTRKTEAEAARDAASASATASASSAAASDSFADDAALSAGASANSATASEASRQEADTAAANAQAAVAAAVAAAAAAGDWGGIGGTLADQVDLKAALDGKAEKGNFVHVTDTTNRATTSSAFVPTGIGASIAIKASSKVLVIVAGNHGHTQTSFTHFTVTRDGVELTPSGVQSINAQRHYASSGDEIRSITLLLVDEPGVAGTYDYALCWKTNGGTAYLGRRGGDLSFDVVSAQITLIEVEGV